MVVSGIRRRLLIAGSASEATDAEALRTAHAIVGQTAGELTRRGATFVIPIDAEPRQKSGERLPITFDWTVLEAVWEARDAKTRPPAAEPLIVAVTTVKGLGQVPPDRKTLWQDVLDSGDVNVVSLGDMNSGALRRRAEADHAQALIALGGGEGVRHLADLLHSAGHPVLPLGSLIGRETEGANLLALLARTRPADFFEIDSRTEAAFLRTSNHLPNDPQAAATSVVELISRLAPPTAFAVRLLNPENPSYAEVEAYFTEVVEPVAESAGYRVITAGRGTPAHAFMNVEIFERLHGSDLTIADLTENRANCYLELGYALGHRQPSLILAKRGTVLAFDTDKIVTHFWTRDGGIEAARKELEEHWRLQIHRPPIVMDRSLS